jgi:ABC-type multidrug transport system fused ATPase/permease subunit
MTRKRKRVIPALITITFGMLGELLINGAAFLALFFAVYWSWSITHALIYFFISIALGFMCLLIELGYGINRKHGWIAALRRIKAAREKSLRSLPINHDGA